MDIRNEIIYNLSQKGFNYVNDIVDDQDNIYGLFIKNTGSKIFIRIYSLEVLPFKIIGEHELSELDKAQFNTKAFFKPKQLETSKPIFISWIRLKENEYKGMGLGKAMFDLAIEELKKRKALHLLGFLKEGYQRIRPISERLGYKELNLISRQLLPNELDSCKGFMFKSF